MAAPRQTQHRAQRDARRQRRALAEAKRQFHQSEAVTKRLVEALEKSSRPRVVVVAEPEKSAPPPKPDNPCPQCGAELREIDLGRMKMVACPECKYHAKS